MVDTALPTSDNARLAPLAAVLTVSQVSGWGTTFWLPAMLADSFGRDIGIAPETAFGGVTVMMLVSALVAPRFGRMIDTYGSRWPMVAGSLLMGLAMLMLSRSSGTLSYLAAWVVIGIAAPLALTQAAAAAMAQGAGSRARQAIGLLMLMGGLSSTVYWPLTAWLDQSIGWRATCIVFAVVHVALCAPLHALAVKGKPTRRAAGEPLADPSPPPPRLSPKERRSAFMLMATAFSLMGFVSWGLPLQLVEILKAYGHPVAFAVFAGTLMGPAQIVARFAEMTLGKSVGILSVGVISAALMPVAVLLPIMGPASPAVAIGFSVGYGMAAGTIGIVRNVAPLVLFGRETFATMNGWLSLPQNMAFALSPMAFAAVMHHSGPTATLLLALGAALAALGVMTILERRFHHHAGA